MRSSGPGPIDENGEPSRYAAAGVDIAQAERGVGALVDILSTIDPGRPPRTALRQGHYAAVLRLTTDLCVAIATDGVGTKILVAAELGKFDTIGIDCVAMNANDLVCVGAEPLALVDYIAVEEPRPDLLAEVAVGLKAGAEMAGIEIPGGEVAQMPEVVSGPGPGMGLDLVGTCIGTVATDGIVTGEAIRPGDALIGLPASGVHSNGLTLARRALFDQGGLTAKAHVGELGRTVGEELLEPTRIYVRDVLALRDERVDARGMAHITGGGLKNLLRLSCDVGYHISDPLPVASIFDVIQRAGSVSDAEMREVFNMGTGFVCVVAARDADRAERALAARCAGARRIGTVTSNRTEIRLDE